MEQVDKYVYFSSILLCDLWFELINVNGVGTLPTLALRPFLGLLCIPVLFNPLAALYLPWRTVSCIAGPHSFLSFLRLADAISSPKWYARTTGSQRGFNYVHTCPSSPTVHTLHLFCTAQWIQRLDYQDSIAWRDRDLLSCPARRDRLWELLSLLSDGSRSRFLWG